MMSKLPVDVGIIYEGERIRKANMYADLAGPKSKGAELLKVVAASKVKDGSVTVIGPDLKDMKEGSAYPFGVSIEVSGKKLEEDLEGVFERRIHDFMNYIQGMMHLNSRDIIWCRISKEANKAGLGLNHVGQAMVDLFKAEFDVIEKIQVTFYTDDKKIDKFLKDARAAYEKRDAKVRGLKDEDVDTFYGCLLCQSFAPKHVCTITPSRTSSCGSITWFEGRAAVKVDPKGPIFAVEKGEVIDLEKGEYSGINEMTVERSNGEVERVYLHSLFDYPHTSCGCFEAIGFYIPEVDGIGVVHRDFRGVTPFGIPFSTMAGQVGGGVQSEGFQGMAIEYMRSSKFFAADGGWQRTVWMPKALKDRIGNDIPEDVRDKIATEEEATDLDSLKAFLKEKNHPVVARWKEAVQASADGGIAVSQFEMPVAGVPMAGGGMTIIFKNAKIYAEKVIIKRNDK
ncbi:CO dehydrogenase/CO-methylating acetyl-CoA synthase complex subunit beta [archaeon]|nr:CO dehydrogenase/CO-methylating acetyl-CoA synthase complex subunit beta [archaeon]